MANTILLKRSATTTNVPTAGELSQGELAINTADERLFSKNSSNVVFEITDHDNLTNYVANEHIDWTSTSSNLSTTGTVTALRLQSNEWRGNPGTNNQLIANAGESYAYATGQTGEFFYVNAESGLQINSSPDNWTTGWAGRKTATICDTSGNSSLPGTLNVTGAISGPNVTSGSDPGHTHTAYLTGNQTITLSGDVTGSGATAITTTVVNDSHTHSDTMVSIGDLAAETLRSVHATGIYTYNSNNQSLGDSTPTSYWSVLGFGQGTGGMGQLAVNWTSVADELWFRSLRDVTDNWWTWKRLWHGDDFSATDVSNWNVAYGDKVNSASFATGTGILTLTRQDAGTVTVDLDGRYITGNQTITLSGDVTGSGTTGITTTIAAGAVDIAMLSATGTPSASTYLRGDNTWATIAGGGTVTSVSAGNGMSFTTITSTGSVTMGTPGTLTASTSNGVTATSHTHAITTTGTGTIVASTSPTFVTKSTHDTIFLNERASATTDVAGDGQLWVRNNAPNDLYFTTDNGLDYPVAYARYRVTADTTLDGANVSETLGVQHINGCWYSDNATAYTLTLQANTVTTFPVGAQMTIWNEGTGTLTITEGSLTTLYVLTGSAVTDAAGSATMAQGGYATLIRKSTTVYLLMGAGITP